jgi:monoamine oxidase
MSIYLGEQIKNKGAVIKLNYYAKQIIQEQDKCIVVDKRGEKIEGDLLVMAMPPCSVNKIDFTPRLST